FKKGLLERRQLHRILANELWLFGEQYSLGVDDESLRALLAKHINILERDAIVPPIAEVTDLEGRVRRVDLMVYRRYPLGVAAEYEHLVIELRRPSCKIGKAEISQILDYAFAVSADERFD